MTITDTHGTLHRADRLACLLCDADLHPLIVDGRGVPLHLGRTVRLVTAGQRRALTIRDGGCTFPGCEAPPDWCDAHHVLEWLRGGRTDVSALLSLCRRHHGVAHRTGWSVVLDDDGWSRWTSPSGVTRWGQRHHRQRAGPAPAPS